MLVFKYTITNTKRIERMKNSIKSAICINNGSFDI